MPRPGTQSASERDEPGGLNAAAHARRGRECPDGHRNGHGRVRHLAHLAAEESTNKAGPDRHQIIRLINLENGPQPEGGRKMPSASPELKKRVAVLMVAVPVMLGVIFSSRPGHSATGRPGPSSPCSSSP